LHPTQGGGFEIPVMEAIMSGCPPITSDFVGIPEIVPDENIGWLIPAKTKYWSSLDSLQFIGDEYKIAEALEDAYNNPDKLKVLAKNGRKHALENYTVKHCNDAWFELFEEMRDMMSYKSLKLRQM
jgi:glycosyltransferase involved in cell wall biosynthesis